VQRQFVDDEAWEAPVVAASHAPAWSSDNTATNRALNDDKAVDLFRRHIGAH